MEGKREKEHGSVVGEAAKRAMNGRAEGRGKRYGEAVKRLVVERIDAGKLTVSQAQRQYGIAGSQTIRGWQSKYGKKGGGTKRGSALAVAEARIEQLKREKSELERALAKSTVKVIVLESAMEEAEVQYGEEFKKKFGSGPWNARGDGSGGKG
jgi:transposase-like protein